MSGARIWTTASRPAGLIHLSSTTVRRREDHRLRGDRRYRHGDAQPDALPHDSGALVFSAGTVQWAWGLDGNHDRGAAAPRPGDAAGDHQPARRHGRAARLAAVADPVASRAKSTDAARPDVRGDVPCQRRALSAAANAMTITGTASDNGGVVAGVEVSVDGGATWHPAQGTASWTYEWSPGAPGQATHSSRAVDDSGNLERPAPADGDRGHRYLPVPELWSASTVPAIARCRRPEPGRARREVPQRRQRLHQGRPLLQERANTGTHVGNLWTSTGTLLATATFTNETRPAGRRCCSTPGRLTANTTYVVSYHTTSATTRRRVPTSARRASTARRCTRRPSTTVGGNGVFIYGAERVPDADLQRDQLLGGRRVRQHAGHDAAVIGDVRATAVDSSIAVVTWTTDEPVDLERRLLDRRGVPTGADAARVGRGLVTAHSVRLTGLRPTRRTSSASVRPIAPVTCGEAVAPARRRRRTPAGRRHRPEISPCRARPCMTRRRRLQRRGIVWHLCRGNRRRRNDARAGRRHRILRTAMPADWSTQIWSTGGGAVNGGRLIVDGARVAQHRLGRLLDSSSGPVTR